MAIRLLHVATVPMSLRFLRGQLGYMRARGIEPAVLTSPGAELDEFGAAEGVPAHGVAMAREITPLRDLASLAAVVRVLLRTRPQVVHGHTPKGGLLAMLAAWTVRTPVRVYHLRGLAFETASGGRRFLLRACERVSCALAHRVICVGASLRDVAVRDGVCAPEKIRVLAGGSGNGVDAGGRFDPARFGPGERLALRAAWGIPADAPLVLFVGRVVRDKGIVELEEAWRRVREELPGAHLLLVGPLESRDPLPGETAERLRADPRVHLAGMQAESAPFYAAADVVVLPTYREGFPNVALEGAAMGLPVVATRIPGCADAVDDGRTGVLVPPRDAPSLAAALLRYLRDPELRRAHGRAGRERVLRDFRPEAVWAALHDEYAALLRGRRVRGAVAPRPAAAEGAD